MWCILELNLSIIGGNIPAAKPLFAKLFPRVFGSSNRDTTTWRRYHNSASQSAAGTATVGGTTFSISKGGRLDARVTTADNTSEEYIMQDQSIRKTVEYGYEVSEEDREAQLGGRKRKN